MNTSIYIWAPPQRGPRVYIPTNLNSGPISTDLCQSLKQLVTTEYKLFKPELQYEILKIIVTLKHFIHEIRVCNSTILV